jgi:hypothetical protein
VKWSVLQISFFYLAKLNQMCPFYDDLHFIYGTRVNIHLPHCASSSQIGAPKKRGVEKANKSTEGEVILDLSCTANEDQNGDDDNFSQRMDMWIDEQEASQISQSSQSSSCEPIDVLSPTKKLKIIPPVNNEETSNQDAESENRFCAGYM